MFQPSTFPKVRVKQISHRRHMHLCIIFYVRVSTHVSIQYTLSTFFIHLQFLLICRSPLSPAEGMVEGSRTTTTHPPPHKNQKLAHSLLSPHQEKSPPSRLPHQFLIFTTKGLSHPTKLNPILQV